MHMLLGKGMKRILIFPFAVMIAGTLLLWVWASGSTGGRIMGYEDLLFDNSRVHSIDIRVDDWEGFLQNAVDETYTDASVTIDGETFGHVGLRGKGNTSLSSVAAMNSRRYSLKLEFDHYTTGGSYHGLDKLCLNNLIQDATFMKDYLAYTLMSRADVPSPLCSYVYITVNGEDWGLYLAVEAIENGFLDRNSLTTGELYKPDSTGMGGGRGNGRDFDMEDFEERLKEALGENATEEEIREYLSQRMPSPPGGGPGFPGQDTPSGSAPAMQGGSPGSQEATPSEAGRSAGAPGPGFGGGMPGGMGSDAVKLIYTDDDPDSYAEIFQNAKTTVTRTDKARLIAALKKLQEGGDPESTVNREEVISYLAIHSFLCNSDSYTGTMIHNYYLYEDNGKLSILPWDYNLSFGGFDGGNDPDGLINSPIDTPVSQGDTSDRPLIHWIFESEEALSAYHARYSELLASIMESGWLSSEITRVQEMILPYIEKDPTAFYTADEFEAAVSNLQKFCDLRTRSIRAQLEGDIPSTRAGQSEAPELLLSAGDLNVTAMGSMGGGMGPGNPGEGGGLPGSGGPPGGRLSGSSTSGARSASSEETPSPQDGASIGAFPSFGGPGGPPGMESSAESTAPSAQDWLLTGGCLVVILLSLFLIRKGRSHNR